jgi:hypothetical protein
MSAEPPPPPRLSEDGRYYWDDQRWVPTLSDDQRSRWDGTKWVAVGQVAPTQLAQQPSSTSVVVYGARTSGLAVGALIAGIASWVLCPGIAAIVAVVLGHSARSHITRTGEGGSGMAMAGLILGYIQLVAAGLIFLFWIGGAFLMGVIGVSTRH